MAAAISRRSGFSAAFSGRLNQNTMTPYYLASLEDKLQLIAEGEMLELTPEEAIIYGVDYADTYDGEEDDYGDE